MKVLAMRMRFIETKVEEKQGRIMLLAQSGQVLLEMNQVQYESAVRAGLIDPQNLHYSLYEYARMIRETSVVQSTSKEPPFRSHSDRDFLASCNISWP